LNLCIHKPDSASLQYFVLRVSILHYLMVTALITMMQEHKETACVQKS
jgi:hypothetical protein